MRRLLVVCVVSCLAAFSWSFSTAENAASSSRPPQVEGGWIGVWGGFDPSKSDAVDRTRCKAMECRITQEKGVWSATFEGECGRPYKYTISMEGRESNGTVLFKGTADLGPQDGGIYDWVGRATETDLVGFYTSSHHTGVFNLTRK